MTMCEVAIGKYPYTWGGKNERHGTSFGNYWVRSLTSWNKDAKMTYFTFYIKFRTIYALDSAFHSQRNKKSEIHFTL